MDTFTAIMDYWAVSIFSSFLTFVNSFLLIT